MMPKCPSCNVEIYFSTSEEPFYDGDICNIKWHGTCHKCMKHYKWYEVYKLESVEDFEEDKQLE